MKTYLKLLFEPFRVSPSLIFISLLGSLLKRREMCPMTLGEKQELFMRLLPKLINKAHKLGFEIRGGDLFRDPRAFGRLGVNIKNTLGKWVYGHKSSGHKLKLAIDLNLFKFGSFMVTTEDHRELGEWWEEQHELCSWGGHFNDGNHYSLKHNGVK